MIKKTLEYILNSIASKPESINIEECLFPYAVSYEVTVDEEDKGVVIGKAGKTIKSINRVISSIAHDKSVSIDIQ
jgi:predicted RNA-binding protein YlqC (UPF0109 family)